MSTDAPPVGAAADLPSSSDHLVRRLLRNPTGLFSVVFLALVAVVAVLSNALAPADPNHASLKVLQPPGTPGFPLGSDGSGQDILSRLIVGTRLSMGGALLALVVAAAIGVVAGLIAGYYQGWFDQVSQWTTNLLMALPGIVVLLALRAAIGPTLWVSMAVFGVLMSPAFFRLVYASVGAVRNELYVDAARVSGLSDLRIITRHIMSVVRAPIVIQSATVMAIALAIQSGLEFLGLGDPVIPTWGKVLSDAYAKKDRAPINLLWPSLAIGLTCVALVLFANALRDTLERSNHGVARHRKGAAPTYADTGAATIAHGDDEHAALALGEKVLEVSELVVGYDRPDGGVTVVVDHVSLTVRRGEVHGLIGESGSGKTQTAFAVLGLLAKGGAIRHGSVLFEGTDLVGGDDRLMRTFRGKKISYIPQEPMSNLDPSFTVGSQLVEPMRLTLGLSKADAIHKALALLDRVGIPDPSRTFRAYPHELSGGMAQRVLIAGAVSCDPDLLIADEPTTALDVTVQAEVLDLLRDLQDERQMGVLMVTHNFGVVSDLCDRVSVMQNGRIVESGPVRTLFRRAEHAYTQSLLDAILDENGPARGPLVPSGKEQS